MPKRLRLALLSLILPLAGPIFAASPSQSGATAGSGDAPAPAAQAPAAPDDLQKQLADVRDQLADALHSFSLLHDEDTQLKENAEKDAADKATLEAQIDSARRTIADLTVQASAATRLAALEAELRQAQDQIAALVAENGKLRIRLALAAPPPAGGMPVPTRPAQH